MKGFGKNPFSSKKNGATAIPQVDEDNPFEDENNDIELSTNVSVADTVDDPVSGTIDETPIVVPTKKKKAYLAGVQDMFMSKKTTENGLPTGNSPEDIAAREAAIKRREEKLAEAEAEIEEREKKVRVIEGHANNWPFKFYAVLHHDIREDIQPAHQAFIRNMYRLVRFEWVCLIFNAIALCVGVFTSYGSDGDTSACGSSYYLIWNLVYIGFGLFGAWYAWYQPIYVACKSSSINSIRYGRFFCGFICHYIWVVLMGVGLWGGEGILTVLGDLSEGCHASLVFDFISMLFWWLNFFATSALLKIAYSKYRAGGGNMKSMKSGLTAQAARAALA